ncbi:MAG: redoxin domain-containing protein [Candidatus Pacebacteria bacterium]|nr:redoxin domain-containing protein [Candidatus Paceibacterota bacterium]
MPNLENQENTQGYNLIGSLAPELELEAYHQDEIKKIKLSDYRGKWLILFFYPADFTFVCPTELKDLSNHYKEIKDLKAEVLSVSTDTVFVHKAWHDNSESIKAIEFPMLADPTASLCKALGTYLPLEGVSLRASFIIDPEGIIKAMEINDNSIGRSGAELIRKLQAAIYTHEHGGEACPANWQPGSKSIKPGLDLVGKI